MFFHFFNCSAQDVVAMTLAKMNLTSLMEHMELVEDVMGKGNEFLFLYPSLPPLLFLPSSVYCSLPSHKQLISTQIERKLKETESALLSKDKWPNKNPTYCKSLVDFIFILNRCFCENSVVPFFLHKLIYYFPCSCISFVLSGKFKLNIKRGSPADAQMKFREAIYGK